VRELDWTVMTLSLVEVTILATPIVVAGLGAWLILRRRRARAPLLALAAVIIGLVGALLVYALVARPSEGTLVQSSPSPDGSYIARTYYVDDYGMGPMSALLLLKVAAVEGDERLIHIDSVRGDSATRTLVWRDPTYLLFTGEFGHRHAFDVATASSLELPPDFLDGLTGVLAGALVGVALTLLCSLLVAPRRPSLTPSPLELRS
jgi:hypothetical protein